MEKLLASVFWDYEKVFLCWNSNQLNFFDWMCVVILRDYLDENGN